MVRPLPGGAKVMVGSRHPSDLREVLGGAYEARRAQLRAVAAKAGPGEAEDIVHDAFLRALEAEQGQPIDRPIQFLARIARNAVIDRLRRKGRWASVVDPAEAPDAPDDHPDPERALISADRLRRAVAIIDSMPERRREIFLSHRLDAVPHAELARRLGVSRKTVEAEMTKAMAQLSRELEGD